MITLSLKEWVIVHINYRGIFNAPVSLSELQQWMNLKEVEPIQAALSELIAEDLIESDGKLNYCIKGKTDSFLHSEGKRRLSRRALKNHTRIIRYISWMPFIRFIGASGSVAADNPTVSKEGIHKNSFDLDIFIITESNTLWLVLFVQRIIAKICSLLLGGRYKFCFNYSMDATFLKIHNQSIYTATELYNLKPLYDKMNAYHQLVTANKWAEKYYPALNIRDDGETNPTTTRSLKRNGVIAYSFNFIAYTLFQSLSAVKHLSMKPLFDIKKEFDPTRSKNLTRVCNENGGYEPVIMNQFDTSLRNHFRSYYNADMLSYLFPLWELQPYINFDMQDEYQRMFTKYIVSR